MMLFNTREEADAVLAALDDGGIAATRDGFIVNRFRDHGGSSNPIQDLGTKDRRRLMFTNRDSAAQIAEWHERERKAELSYSEASARAENLSSQFRRVEPELRDAEVGALL